MNLDSHTFDDLLFAVAWWLLVGCAAWSVLICAAAVVEAMSRGRLRATTWVGCPPALRRLLLAGLGVALASVPPLGQAAAAPRGPGLADPHAAAAQQALPVPARPIGPAQTRTTQVVRAGDTLWHLAELRLPTSASPAEVADLVARLHRRNRVVIGSDPDLIRPGQRLICPSLRLAPARPMNPSPAESTPRGEP